LAPSVDADVGCGNRRLDAYLEQYYRQGAAVVRDRQECYAGPPSGLEAYLTGYAMAGAAHLILRGAHARHLELVAAARSGL